PIKPIRNTSLPAAWTHESCGRVAARTPPAAVAPALRKSRRVVARLKLAGGSEAVLVSGMIAPSRTASKRGRKPDPFLDLPGMQFELADKQLESLRLE